MTIINIDVQFISGKQNGSKKSSVGESSVISTYEIEQIVDKLMMQQHRSSTARTCLSVWRQFNKFILRFDRRSELWEDRVTLFLGYLIEHRGMQSSTIKSYLSAIKKTLVMDGYKWNDNLVLIRSLAKACKIVNDTVRTRLLINCNLLEILLFEVQCFFTFKNQYYLEILYKTIFIMCY